MAKEAKTETFEQTYTRLEASVEKLERGGLTLDEAIALYEEGMGLARKCQDMLDAAELKITKLKESFAPIAERTNGRSIGEEVAEYEYVPEDDTEPTDDDPFA
jgi:exodeoxyribonuclease VII small subunit